MSENEFPTTIRLVHAARDGDDQALNRLFERYLPRIRRIVCLRMGWRLQQFEEHEDLVQETMLKLFQGLERFEVRSEGSFRQWVSTCVECAIKDSLRQATRKKRGGGKVRRLADFPGDSMASSIFQDSSPSPSQVLRAKELEEKIEASLLKLPERYRELIILKSFCDMSHAEIAEALGLKSENTARQAYFRAVEKLKELIAG